MKKIALALATVSTLAFALPSLASAETVVIKRGHHHMDRGWHHSHMDRGWHHGHGRKVVVIKHGHHHYD
ncbi:hypothetical protein [Bradyrhizobium sp. SYSU BS000235]|uniref:hypothetical protein n=1 Tax=Bradyrhizobium sp. SYSU BS000235 TaxID=3411332 RepID=UPI003C7464F5